MTDNSDTRAELETLLLRELFKKNLSIPDYQRPYEWGGEQVEQLLKDIENAGDRPYLMGTVILHQVGDRYDIVDGQQRLLTLTLLAKAVEVIPESMPLLEAEVRHKKSQFFLWNNHRLIQDKLNGRSFARLADNIQFHVITIQGRNALDLAYTFFDSQNSKGAKLTDYNLLKAHHLQFIPDSEESLAKAHNEFWEARNDRHGLLFGELLRRIRMWSRGEERDRRAERGVYNEFVSQCEPSEVEQREHLLNRYQQPFAFRSWYRENGRVVLNMKYPMNEGEDLLPMEIPQTIEGGDAFFLYAKRYYKVYEQLFKNTEPVTESVLFVRKLSNDFKATALHQDIQTRTS